MTTPPTNRPMTGVSRPEPERDGAVEPWETGADVICAAMVERSAKSIKRVSEDLYEAMMNDVQDWLRENVTYNLSGELSRRDREISDLKTRLATAERQRDERGRALKPFVLDYEEAWSPEENGGYVFPDDYEIEHGATSITVGDLRAARQALQSIGSGE